jgi:hypothetical protein
VTPERDKVFERVRDCDFDIVRDDVLVKGAAMVMDVDRERSLVKDGD